MFSIIITAHNQAPELRRHLPAILEQDFDDYEVIVVDMASADETQDLLEELELRYLNLRHTHTPPSARDISLERLALNIGIRSARFDWVIITHSTCQPATPHWLQAFAAEVKDKREILIGAAKYDEEPDSWFHRKVGFFRLWNTLANMHHVRSGNVAVRADGCNLALRRDLFLSANAFSDHLNLLAGTEELLVNQLSTNGNTAVVESSDAIVVEDPLPEQRLWKKQRVYYMETRRHQRRTFLYRTKQNLRLLLPWLLILAPCLLYPILIHQYPGEELFCGIITAPVALLAIMLLVGRLSGMNKDARLLGYERHYGLSGLLFTLLMPFWNLSAWLTYLRSPKAEFRKKFV